MPKDVTMAMVTMLMAIGMLSMMMAMAGISYSDGAGGSEGGVAATTTVLTTTTMITNRICHPTPQE